MGVLVIVKDSGGVSRGVMYALHSFTTNTEHWLRSSYLLKNGCARDYQLFGITQEMGEYFKEGEGRRQFGLIYMSLSLGVEDDGMGCLSS